MESGDTDYFIVGGLGNATASGPRTELEAPTHTQATLTSPSQTTTNSGSHVEINSVLLWMVSYFLIGLVQYM